MNVQQGLENNSFLLTNELVFTKLFATQENDYLLKHFLKDCLGINAKTTIPELVYDFQEFKSQFYRLREEGIWLPMVEISIELNDGHWIILDLQKFPRHKLLQQVTHAVSEKFKERYQETFYSEKDTTNYVKRRFKTMNYFSILDFVYFKQDRRLTRSFSFLDNETKEPVSEEAFMSISFFEVRKQLEPSLVPRSRVQNWQELFLTGKVAATAPDYLQEVANYLKETSFTLEEAILIKEIAQAQAEFVEILDLIRANTNQLFTSESS